MQESAEDLIKQKKESTNSETDPLRSCSQQRKKKINKTSKENLCALWGTIKCNYLHFRSPREGERKGRKFI